MNVLNRRLHLLSAAVVAVIVGAALSRACLAADPSGPQLLFPKIEKYGSVVALPDAGERPRAGGKVVFDTTAAAASGKPNRGLESAARLVNIYELENLADGAEVWVCGQLVIRGGNRLDDVMPGIRVAHSAMIFNLNRQTDGWATLGVH